MNARRSNCFVGLLLAAVGCAQARFAQTAENPQDASASVPECPVALRDRISMTQIDLSGPVRYKRQGYEEFPRDERVALSVDADTGTARVAWLDAAGQNVHVIPLNAKLKRMAADAVLPGRDIGGLAARRDGFALLTRGRDPGQQLTDPANSNAVADAALLVRQRDGSAGFSVALTGTSSITQAGNPLARDCAPLMSGRLIWNGAKYGAYFVMHGCTGDPHASLYGDKLVYIDDYGGALSRGWSWNCSIDESLRLWAEPDAFTSLCLSDNQPAKGLNLVFSDAPSKLLAPEAATDGWVGGQFGSVVRMTDGTYVVTWTSRSVDSTGQPAKPAPDIAVIRLSANYSVIEPMRWLRETADIAELNLHMAPYGHDRLLLVWDEMDSLVCDTYVCFGRYTGTHARLLDSTAHFLSTDTTISAVPNSEDDIAVLPNGDLAWAFVPDDARSYAAPLTLDSQGNPRVQAKSTIQIARVTFCGGN